MHFRGNTESRFREIFLAHSESFSVHCSQIRSGGQLLTFGFDFILQMKLLAVVELGIWSHKEEEEKKNGELEIACLLLRRIRSFLV